MQRQKIKDLLLGHVAVKIANLEFHVFVYMAYLNAYRVRAARLFSPHSSNHIFDLWRLLLPVVVASQEEKTHNTVGTQRFYWQDGGLSLAHALIKVT